MIQKYLQNFTQPLLSMPAEVFLEKMQVLEQDGITRIILKIGFPLTAQEQDQIISHLSDFLYDHGVEQAFEFEIKSQIIRHKAQGAIKPYKNIKNIVAVGSGKGGVGKSTVTANLAIALAKTGAKVGVLDADIYGPSQPTIMGALDNPKTNDQKKIEPLERHGVKMMSIGNLIDQDSAIIWRGPVVSKALMQLLNDTNWGELDYLFVDLPPGTGDVQLTMTKHIPLTAAVVVTTPQDLSLIDAKRAIGMFNKMSIHVAGVVENMSLHICENCGHQSAIFGQHAAIKLCEKFEIPYLGELPLEIKIREGADTGVPIATGDSDTAKLYRTISLELTALMSQLPKASMISMPSVKVEYSDATK